MSAFALARGVEDLLRRHHDAEVDHREVVALEDDADDVLADVVDVALHRRHHDRALGLAGVARLRLFRLDERHQVPDRLLHHARALDHLRQEHLAGAEEIADDVHPRHQRAFDHLDGARELLSRLLGVLDDVRGDSTHQRMREPLFDRPGAPRQVLGDLLALRLERLRERDQPLRRVGTPIEHDVLDALAQLGGNLVVDAELAGVDDAHRHSRADRVIEEHRVDRLAHGLVAAEAEAHVRHAARHLRLRQVLPYPAGGVDEVDRVVVVLLDARRDREDVGIEDDVLGREADLARQQVVRALADLDLALERVGLAALRRRPSRWPPRHSA